MAPDPAGSYPDDNSPTDIYSERQSHRWDLRNAFRNYSTLVAAQAVIALFSFASVWLLTRTIGADGYGGVVAVIAASFVAQMLVNWTCGALSRFGVEEFVTTGRIDRSFWGRTIVFLPNTAVLIGLSFLWLPFFSDWLKLDADSYWYVLAHFAALAIWTHVQFAVQGAKLPTLQSTLLGAERAAVFAILLGMALLGSLNVYSALVAYIAVPLGMSGIGLFLIRRHLSWRITIDREWLGRMLRFSYPLIPYWLFGYFGTNYVDAIFISQYLSRAELGVYSVAYQIVGILMQFPVLAGTLLMPLFVTLQASQRDDRVQSYMESVLPVATIGWGMTCAVFGVSAAFLVPILFGAELAEAGGVLLILTITAAVNAPVPMGYGPYVNAVSATYISTISIFVLATVNIAGNLLLIPRFGLAGSAWSTALGYGAGFVVMYAIVQRKYPLRSTWTVQAILPSLAGLGYIWWSGNAVLGLIAVIFLSAGLLFLHRKAVRHSVVFLSNFRMWLSNADAERVDPRMDQVP